MRPWRRAAAALYFTGHPESHHWMATEPCSRIVLPVRLEQLRDLEHWVETLAAEFRLPRSLVHRIDVCLTELVTNLISYGYPDREAGTVSIRLWRQPEQIVICIDDDGAAFDPTSYVAPDLPRSLADATAGGRGIRLVRHFSDEFHHVTGAAGNQLTLMFRNPGTRAHCSTEAAGPGSESPKPRRQSL
jgi:serine/threonine-protein kinase RsbW